MKDNELGPSPIYFLLLYTEGVAPVHTAPPVSLNDTSACNFSIRCFTFIHLN